MTLQEFLSKTTVKQYNDLWFKYYQRFISERIELNKSRILDIKERHHIMPRCLFENKSDANFKDNLIDLTPREHWIAHLLLFRSFPHNKGLSTAAVFMGITREVDFNSRQYETLVIAWKKEASKVMKEKMAERVKTPGYYEKMRTASLKYFEEHPETKKKISESVKKLWENEEYRKRTIEAGKKARIINNFSEKMSNSLKRFYEGNPELKELASKKMKDIWTDEEYKNKQTKSHQNAWKNSETRKKIHDGIVKSWENEELRNRQSDIIRKTMSKPEIKIKYARAYLRTVEKTLSMNPNSEKHIAKRNYWLNKIAQLEEQIKNDIS